MDKFYTYLEYIEAHNNHTTFSKSTYEDYISTSVAFITKNLNKEFGLALDREDNLQFAFKRISERVIELLMGSASVRNSSSWRKLRRSLAVTYEAIGLNDLSIDINSVENPVEPEDRLGKVGRANRKKYVTQEEFELLLNDRINNKELVTAGYIYLCFHLGVRPEEVRGLQYDIDDNTREMYIKVPHVKDLTEGQRGIDRELIIKLDYDMIYYIDIVNTSRKSTDSVRMQIKRAVDRLFPNDKQRISLYSMRYTMGADIKQATQHDPVQTAALLGHKSTASSVTYGNSRQSSNRRPLPQTTPETQQQVEVKSHSLLTLREKIEQIHAEKKASEIINI
ncbi:MAG: site-specific integrase [bacterium]|nr:site-specific integrase [bacterium]